MSVDAIPEELDVFVSVPDSGGHNIEDMWKCNGMIGTLFESSHHPWVFFKV